MIDTSDPAWPGTAAVLREMADAGVEIDRAALTIATKLGAHRLASLDAAKAPSRRPTYDLAALASAKSIVYYIRRGEVIKIGTTSVPVMRFTALLPDEILAFEPGTVREETCRHRQFAHLRCQGEHFRPAPELLAHIRCMRQLHGEPDPAWPTVASLGMVPEPVRDDLPPPVSAEKLTVAEASGRLGIKTGTIRAWVARRRISPAGRDERGRQQYHIEHLLALRDRLHGRPRSGGLTGSSERV
jgi:hypothetical protein